MAAAGRYEPKHPATLPRVPRTIGGCAWSLCAALTCADDALDAARI